MFIRNLLIAMLAVLFLAVPAQAQDPQDQEDCFNDDPDCVPDCPTDLHGMAPETGGVFMSWTLRSFTDVNVYRASGDAEFELIERREFPATKALDLDTEPGETYRYQVTAITDAGNESEACGTIEVTTVPVFGSWLAASAATGLGIVSYAVLARRRSP